MTTVLAFYGEHCRSLAWNHHHFSVLIPSLHRQLFLIFEEQDLAHTKRLNAGKTMIRARSVNAANLILLRLHRAFGLSLVLNFRMTPSTFEFPKASHRRATDEDEFFQSYSDRRFDGSMAIISPSNAFIETLTSKSSVYKRFSRGSHSTYCLTIMGHSSACCRHLVHFIATIG
jgi:hypothetical protein